MIRHARRAGHDRHRLRRRRCPVYDDPHAGWEGIDAVIDKDLAAAVLARDLGAELLLILTDVDAVYADWGTPQQRPLRRLTVGRGGDDGPRRRVRRGQHGAEGSRRGRLRAPHGRARGHHGAAIAARPRCEAKQERPSQHAETA